jgi:hypothetical protein
MRSTARIDDAGGEGADDGALDGDAGAGPDGTR